MRHWRIERQVSQIWCGRGTSPLVQIHKRANQSIMLPGVTAVGLKLVEQKRRGQASNCTLSRRAIWSSIWLMFETGLGISQNYTEVAIWYSPFGDAMLWYRAQ